MRISPSARRADRVGRRLLLAIAAAIGAALVTVQATDQQPSIPSSNVNVISGTGPDGDWTLQRQNEPSGACSSRNPQNCLFGGNDYRSVDIPFPPDAGRVIGDAWLGWYTTKDGGQTWKTRLLPGYPQDASPEGMASPLKGMEAGADPVVRSGANGMFFYAGIAFVRGPGGGSRLFVARFIDNNDRERPDVESITYLDTRVIQAAPQGTVSNFFVDKPWIAVDIPRPGARRCRIGGRSTGVSRQSLPCARVYIAYTVFTGEAPNQRATIMIARSEDSGATWSPAEPLQIDGDVDDDGAITNVDLNLVKQGNRQVCQTPGYNEALDLNLDCSVNSRDANLVTRLIGSTPPGTVKSVHQGAALAIAPSTGAVHLAYRQFKSGTSLDAIFATRSTDGGVTFSTPSQVSPINPFDQGTSTTSFRTNAFPTLAVDEVGRSYLAWTTRGLAEIQSDPVTGDARIVLATSADGLGWSAPRPVDNHPEPGHQFMPSLVYAAGRLQLLYYDQREDRSQLFGPYVDELPIINGPSPRVRHTTEVRGASAAPGLQPVFETFRVSDYMSGVQPGTDIVTQLQFDPPNLPMFRLGTAPFIGDYIEIIPAQSIVPAGDGFQFNTAPSPSPLFHAIWTDNRDVRPPPDGDWTKYTPPNPSFPRPTTSGFDPSQTIPQCTPGFVATRNQNIYTARVSGGLVVGALTNAKQLGTISRSFPIYVQNATRIRRSYRLTIETQPAGGRASFDQFTPVTTLDVQVPPLSTIARSVHATSSDPRARIPVDIVEITAPGGTPVAGGQEGEIVLNPDRTNPDVENPDVENPDVENPDVENPDVENFEVYNPDVENGALLGLANPDVENPDVENPDVENVLIVNPSVATADPANPDVENPDVENPDVENPDVENLDLVNGGLTDTTWTLTNRGNTAASYSVKLLLNRTLPPGFRSQLIVHRVYQTPAVQGCDLKQQTQNVLLINLPNPSFATGSDLANPDVENPDVENVTVAIPPASGIRVTLRVYDPNRFDAQTFDALAAVTPAMVAHSVDTASVIAGQTTPSVAAPLLLPPDPPAVAAGTAYSYTLPKIGTGTFSIVGGALPQGLALDPATGVITGTATVGGEYTFVVRFVRADAIEDFQTVTLQVAAAALFADLAVAITDSPDPALIGTPLTYQLTVVNNGPTAAENVVLTQSLPVGAALVSATPSQGSCTPGTSLTCELAGLASGATATVAVVVTPGSSGFASATASVTSTVADATPANNTAGTTTLVQAFAACSAPTFSGPRLFTTGGAGTVGLHLDDFTGDGVLDTVTLHPGASSAALLRGNGQGAFGSPSHTPLGFTPSALAIADFDTDGDPDVVVAGATTDAALLVNDGAGNFTVAPSIPVGFSAADVETGDFNNDGNPDLLFAGFTGSLAFVGGNGDGTFDTAQVSSVGSAPLDLVVADFDLDGYVDAAVGDRGQNVVTIRRGDGSGAFTSGVALSPGSGLRLRHGLGDINLDGRPDLAVTIGAEPALQTLIYLGDGSGGFAAPFDAGAGGSGDYATAADLTGDGLPDLVTAHPAQGRVSVQVGTGTSFGPAISFPAANPAHVRIADVNGDLKPDIVVAVAAPDAGVTVLLNACSASQADLSVVASDAPDPVAPGATLTYSMTVTNNGPIEATGVVASAALSTFGATIGVVSASQGACAVVGQFASCDIGTLPAGGSATIIVEASSSVNGLVIRTTLGATASQADPDTSNNARTLATAVNSAPLVSIAVAPLAPAVPQGSTQPFTATGTFADASSQDLTNLVLWSSSIPAVATISNSDGTRGLATALGDGTTTITATSGLISGNTTLTVTSDAAVITNVAPVSGAQGASLDVTITGQNTHFVQGETTASFGQGIAIDAVNVTSPTTATVTISIDPLASPGTRAVTLATGTEFATSPAGFTVTVGPAALTSVAPASGRQGEALSVALAGTGTHFAQGATFVSAGAGIAVSEVLVSSPTSATVEFAIDPSAPIGPRTVTVTTGGEQVSLPGFAVLSGLPAITDVTPTSGAQGSSLAIDVTAQFTNFAQGETTATLGAGIFVNSVTVTSATAATINVTISPTATVGTRGITLTTGGEIVSTGGGFAVTAGPATLAQIAPTSGTQGQILSVDITGVDTHFVQGVTAIGFGRPFPAGSINVIAATVNSPTSVTAQISISADAAVGLWSITATTGGESAVLADAFTVIAATPTILTVVPNQGQQGQTLDVTITGQATAFVQDVTEADFGAGITVNDVTVSSSTSAVVNISVDSLAFSGSRNVVLTTGPQIVTLVNGFTIAASPAALTSVVPGSALQGESLDVQLTGQLTNFQQDVTVASFGADITVNSLTVTSPTTATAAITIAAAALPVPRAVTMATLGEQASLVNGFTVQALPTTPIITAVEPQSGQQGQALVVTVTGQLTNFAQGATTASFGDGVAINSVTVASPTSATVSVTIDPTAFTGTRNVTMTTGTEVAAAGNGFSVAPGIAILTDLNPASGEQGQTLDVAITGTDTHFEQGVTTASFGGDITVNSLTVSSATTATVNISIGASASIGLRTIALTTRGEIAQRQNGFTVIAATPTVTSVTPNSGRQGEQVSVTVLGQFTNFAQGVTTASFGSGIAIDSVTVTSPTSATVVITVDPVTFTGSRVVQMTTGTEVAGGGAFVVTTGTAVLTQITPSSAEQGTAAVPVTITGQNTHFANGVTTAAVSGNGVVAGEVTVTSPTTASVTLSVSAQATPGLRTVTLTTGGEQAQIADGFTVIAATPVLVLATPASGQQGQTLDVAVTGQFTSFQQGTTTADFGAGIAVNLVTVTSATTATVNITVDPVAFTGGRTITLTTGTESAQSSFGAFSVTAGAASLQSLVPNTGRQAESLNVTITGQGTHFAQGQTVASFGGGVSVNQLIISSGTSATANITISAGATPGSRTVTMTSAGESAQIASGFTVTAGLARVTAINPPTGRQAETLNVAVTGELTTFAQGVTTASFGAGITVNSVVVSGTASATLNITIDPSAALGSRTVTMTTGTEVASLVGGFTVQPGLPAIASISPTSGTQGVNLTVVVNGQFTDFTPGVTTASFGSGISVGTVTVNGPTLASVPVTISPFATAGPRTVTLTTGTQVASLDSGFTVQAGTPAVSLINPNIGRPNQNLAVTIEGQFTNFQPGVTQVSFGPGVSVGGAPAGEPGPATVSGSGTLSAQLLVSAVAQLGTRDVVVQTGAEILTVFDGFTVTDTETTPPAVFKVSPAQSATDVPLNTEVTVEFNEPIARTSVTTSSFLLYDSVTGQPVPATVSVDATGRVATLVPTQLLAVHRSHSIYLSPNPRILDQSGNAMSFQIPASFTTGFSTDTTGPTLIETSPRATATAVPLNVDVVLEFDKPVNPITVTSGLRLERAGAPVSGTYSMSAANRIVTFQPSNPLEPTVEYTVVVDDRLRDSAGNSVTNPGSFAFTTGSAADTTAPVVSGTSFPSSTTGVGSNAVIRLDYSERLNPTSVVSGSTIVLRHNASGQAWPSTVTVTEDLRSVLVTPDLPLWDETAYYVTSNSVRDLAGNAGGFATIFFVTGSDADAISPTVTAIAPLNGLEEVPVNARIVVQLSEPIGLPSIPGSIVLSPPASGTITLSADARRLTFVPSAALAVDTSYQVTVSGLRDYTGNVMTPFASSFTTRALATNDSTAPAFVTISPVNGATGIDVTTPITVTISEPIVAGLVSPTSLPIYAVVNGQFVQLAGTYVVAGTGTTITFTPLMPYPGSTLIWTYINATSTITDYAGNVLSFSQRSFTTANAPDTTSPTVISVTPASGTADVGLNAVVTLTFSESLATSTVSSATFELFAGTQRLSSSVQRSADNRSVMLSTSLPPDALVTVVATSGVTDLSGNPLADFTSTFTTAAARETTAGSVVTQVPDSGTPRVPVTTPITLVLSEPVAADSVAPALWVAQDGVLVTGTIAVTSAGTTIEFVPSVPWAAGALVQVFLEGALDLAGNAITTHHGSFRIVADPATAVATLLRAAPSGSGVAINPIVELEFSEALDPDTITEASVRLLLQGSQAVPVTRTLRDGRFIRLTPLDPLTPSQSYYVQVTGVLDEQGQPVTSQFLFAFSTGTATDTTAPIVTAVTPPAGSLDLGTNARIRVRFSEPINPLTVSGSTVAVTATGFVAVPASLSFNPTDSEVTVTPVQPLPANTTITVAISGVEDRSGLSVTPFQSTFETGPDVDTLKPQITFVSPFSGQDDVPVNTVITIEYSELVDPASVQADTVRIDDPVANLTVPTSIALDPDGRTLRIVPQTALAVGRTHYLYVNHASSVRDLAGNVAPSVFLSFTTAFAADTTPPLIVAVNPADNDQQVPTNVALRVVFNEPIDANALDQIALMVGGQLPTTKTLSNGNRTLTVTPATLLTPSTVHTLSLVGIGDTSGNAMAAAAVTFTTALGADLVAPTVRSISVPSGATGVGTNVVLQVVFSEPIDATSIVYGSTVLLRHNATSQAVPATLAVAADRQSLTVTPAAPLLGNTGYFFNTSSLRDLAGNGGGSTNLSFTTGPAADTTGPAVSGVSPINSAIDVPVNTRVVVRLSEPVSALAVGGSLQLTPSAAGTLTLSTDARTVTFVPSSPLVASTAYTVTVSGFRDYTGNVMTPFASTFTTRALATNDITAPAVVQISPFNGESGVGVTTPIVFSLSEPIIAGLVGPASVPIYAVVNSSFVQLAGSYSVNAAGTTITFVPQSAYPGATLIWVYINANSTITDYAGNPLPFTQRSFTTASVADTTAPVVIGVTPVSGAIDVGLNAVVTLTFSESLAPATVSNSTFELFAGSERLSPSVQRSADNRTVTLSTSLPPDELITIVATSGVTDLSGNALAHFTSQFMTAAARETTAGRVTAQRPDSGTTVPADTPITLVLSEPVAPETVAAALRVSQNGTLVGGTVAVTSAGTTIEFVPEVPWTAGALVQIFLEGARDLAGNTLVMHQGSMRIDPDPATTTATLKAIAPSGNAVPLNPIVELEYSEALDGTSLNSTSVRLLLQGSQSVPVTRTLRDGRFIRLTPLDPLTASQSYYVQVSGVLDAQGQPVSPSFNFAFSTGTATDAAAPTVTAVAPPGGSTDVGTNATIRVRFSEPINPLTVNGTTIAVTAPGFLAVPTDITFNTDDTEVTVTPVQPFPSNATLTIDVSGVEDRAGLTVTPLQSSFHTGPDVDTETPSIVRSNPFSGQTNVPVNTVMTIEFSELLDPASIRADTVRLVDSTTNLVLPASITLDANGRTLQVAPLSALVVARVHYLYVNSLSIARDLSGNLAAGTFQSFTTSNTADLVPPIVQLTSPTEGLTGVPINPQIEILFDEPINPSTVAEVQLMLGGTPLPVTRVMANGNRTVRLVPTTLLAPNTSYTISISAVRDVAGNVVAGVVEATFTTGPGTDITAPTVTLMQPAQGATGVAVSVTPQVTFSEAINPLTAVGGIILRVTNTGVTVPVTYGFSADLRTITLTPNAPLASGTQYTFTTGSSVRNLAGSFSPQISNTFTTQ